MKTNQPAQPCELSSNQKKLTSKQKRMQKAVNYLQDYMVTYSNQVGYLDYMDETLIDDVIYGLGMALDPHRYEFAQGFKKFKKRLHKHISKSLK